MVFQHLKKRLLSEISEEAVQNVISSFRSRCTDKIRDIENVIYTLRVLDSNIDISQWRDNIDTLREIDRLVVNLLGKKCNNL